MRAAPIIPSSALESLWDRYQKTHAIDDRNELVAHYLPLVRSTAKRFHNRVPDTVDVEDLVQAGVFGLVEAIKGFDPSRGIKFQTYAVWRIRGAIIDSIRGDDWVPRLTRAKETKVKEAVRLFATQHGRAPTAAELTELLGVDEREAQGWLAAAAVPKIESLSRVCRHGSGSQLPRDTLLADVQVDRRSPRPASRAEQLDAMRLATRGLSKNERLIVILYYWEDLTMKEIGETLGLSESRVSQMHSAILERLKGQLGSRRHELAA